ncbi:hypothetical protein [Rhizobium halophilum]|uniref:hypothetical protein n=1 Tax=Rhizobium halophilum TaxID=2846852 RepID=UPI001EFD6363|nr:hypothetical protein [Rhizobium halophilum]MCF6367534.1 hypothetical protein [Rhizobium halophilum]
MLFGRSVFQSVLTRLDEEAKEEVAATPPGFRVAGLPSGFVAATEENTSFNPARAGLAYRDVLDNLAPSEVTPSAPPVEEQQVPTHLLRLDEADIAEDLALGSEETTATLAEKRRQFAKNNHPDRVPEAWRDSATLRMKTANLLIDRALRELYWRSS